MKKDEKNFAPNTVTPGKFTDDAPPCAVRLYQRKKNGWFIVGYKCPYCQKHYATVNKPFHSHVESCTGPKSKKSLED